MHDEGVQMTSSSNCTGRHLDYSGDLATPPGFSPGSSTAGWLEGCKSGALFAILRNSLSNYGMSKDCYFKGTFQAI